MNKDHHTHNHAEVKEVKEECEISESSSDEEAKEIVKAFKSNSTLSDRQNTKHRAWTNNKEAKQQMFAMVTCAYLLIIVIVGILLELSHILSEKDETLNVDGPQNMLFALYMYGGSLAFLFYVYTVLLKNQFEIWGIKKYKTRSRLNLFMKGVQSILRADFETSLVGSDEAGFDERQVQQPPTGGLFLRIGCVVFGLFGVVYCGLATSLCMFQYKTKEGGCSNYTMVSTGFATLFIFIQMHFVFCNSSIVVHGSLKIARLGMMHLVATNLWTWLRYILIEEKMTTMELHNANFSISHEFLNELHSTPSHSAESPKKHHHDECEGTECVLGNFTEFMYTCIVEYSLICATICFVFWTNIGKGISAYHKKRTLTHNLIAIDCSRTTTGLFFGFILVVLTFICITVFNGYVVEHQLRNAAYMIFYLTTSIFLLLSFAAVIFAFHRMKKLSFATEESDIDESAELLDRILLVFGLTGELIFCIGGIMSLSKAPFFFDLVILLFLTKCLSFIQVLSQSALILIGSKLKASSSKLKKSKPGKQVVTFLLVANIALLIMNTFEAQSAGIHEDIVRLYGSRSWALVIRGCAPLTIFFRFHSAACFADIWKHTYSSVKGEIDMH